MDPYQRNNPISHIKRQTMDLELFPFETQVIQLDASVVITSTIFMTALLSSIAKNFFFRFYSMLQKSNHFKRKLF